jgi:hypothetical protein
VVIKSRARLSSRARDRGRFSSFWHRSKSELRAASSASEIVDSVGWPAPQTAQAGLGDTADVVPHLYVPGAHPQHLRERRPSIGSTLTWSRRSASPERLDTAKRLCDPRSNKRGTECEATREMITIAERCFPVRRIAVQKAISRLPPSEALLLSACLGAAWARQKH